jgi:predicted enzyme related to lactoylglutathione lyase
MPDSAFKFSFDAVYYHVKDMERAIKFYRDVLGFPLKSRDYVTRFEVDGVLFELVPAAAGETISGPGNARLSLGVADIEAAIRYLGSRGVRATPAKQEAGGMLSLFKDPEGNELCLWQTT